MLVIVGVCCVLPLSLLRHLDSLSYICSASMIFYSALASYILYDGMSNSFFATYWYENVVYWRTAGIFRCLPIFCMGLSCQPQVFEVRKAMSELPTAGVTMNRIVSNAVNLCTVMYIIVGFTGYVLFYNTVLDGNILKSYSPTLVIQTIRLAFGISVAVSFPLIVFPCRTAIHSLMFKNPGYNTPLDMTSVNYIPPNRSNGITLAIISVTLVLGIMIPDIETVLGIVGSTIGNLVCILLPTLIFVKLNKKNTCEKFVAQGIFVLGIGLMIAGTYNHLQKNETKILGMDKGHDIIDVKDTIQVVPPVPPVIDVNEKPVLVKDENAARIEPVEPHAPKEEDDVNKETKQDEDSKKKVEDNPVLKDGDDDSGKTSKEAKDTELKAKEAKADKLLKELEKQKEEHKQIIEEQKEVLDRMKQHLEADESAGQNVNKDGQIKAEQNPGAADTAHQANIPLQQQSPQLQQNNGNQPNQNVIANVQSQGFVQPQQANVQVQQNFVAQNNPVQPNPVLPLMQQNAQVQQNGQLQQNIPLYQNAPMSQNYAGQGQPVGQAASQLNQNPPMQVQQNQPVVKDQGNFPKPPQAIQNPVQSQQNYVAQNDPNVPLQQNLPQAQQNAQVLGQGQPMGQAVSQPNLNVPKLINPNQPVGQNQANFPKRPQANQNQINFQAQRQQQQANLHDSAVVQDQVKLSAANPNNQGQVGLGAGQQQLHQRPPQQPLNQNQGPLDPPRSMRNKSVENRKDFKRATEDQVIGTGRDLKSY